jgi:oxygen-independent coproporphyrinogen-3 oxidase
MALDLEPDHLSLYALTVEEGTPLAEWVRSGRTKDPDPDTAADQYLMAGQLLAMNGYEQYEISNWAKPGQECQHNLTYWHNRPYLGLGPGAHSRFADYRFSVIRSPQQYVRWQPTLDARAGVEAAIRSASPIDECTPIDPDTDFMDTVMLGLRLTSGVRFADLLARHGIDARKHFAAVLPELERQWLLAYDPEGMWLTYRGRLLANEVFVRLLNAD